MGRINEDRDSKLSTLVREAYNKGLGPHHPWIVRQGANLAMMAVPSRESFLAEIKAEYSQIKEFAENVEKFRPSLWKYY